MLLFIVAYLGGAFTILSPCILPVLPFVFARSDKPFVRSGLPMLVGMALSFAAVATLAAVGGGWAVQANQYGRIAAMVLLAFFGVTLLIPSLADRLTRPIVAWGSRLSQSADSQNGQGNSIWPSFILGIATGLLWAPCAGPILGLLLTGAALNGASAQTTLLLFAYALGAATSLGLALLVGGRVFTLMKKSLGAGEWVRKGLGALVLAGVVVIALGLDTGLLTRVSSAGTASIEQSLIDKIKPMPKQDDEAGGAMMAANNSMAGGGAMMSSTHKAKTLPVEGKLPGFDGATQWLNSEPLTADSLKGKVVVVDFWTYSCINCIRSLPYIKAWADKYKDQGLVVIGVHAPEFAFEKDIGNVKKAVADMGITYPVAIDNDYKIWQAFNNEYWPAHYFIDANGNIRSHHFGEGNYDQSEKVIQQLLAEAGHKDVATSVVDVSATGAMAAADTNDVKSPETYVGFDRAENFVSPGGAVQNQPHDYQPGTPATNQWSLSGNWTVQGERGDLNAAGGSIVYNFHARDLHLVLGPTAADGKSVRFQVMIDGKPPGASHGVDTDEAGNGTVTGQRLYQLVRQDGAVADHTFEIKFLDPGVSAYAFTFG